MEKCYHQYGYIDWEEIGSILNEIENNMYAINITPDLIYKQQLILNNLFKEYMKFIQEYKETCMPPINFNAEEILKKLQTY